MNLKTSNVNKNVNASTDLDQEHLAKFKEMLLFDYNGGLVGLLGVRDVVNLIVEYSHYAFPLVIDFTKQEPQKSLKFLTPFFSQLSQYMLEEVVCIKNVLLKNVRNPQETKGPFNNKFCRYYNGSYHSDGQMHQEQKKLKQKLIDIKNKNSLDSSGLENQHFFQYWKNSKTKNSFTSCPLYKKRETVLYANNGSSEIKYYLNSKDDSFVSHYNLSVHVDNLIQIRDSMNDANDNDNDNDDNNDGDNDDDENAYSQQEIKDLIAKIRSHLLGTGNNLKKTREEEKGNNSDTNKINEANEAREKKMKYDYDQDNSDNSSSVSVSSDYCSNISSDNDSDRDNDANDQSDKNDNSTNDKTEQQIAEDCLDNVWFNFSHAVTLLNDMGYNEDHRGHDHVPIILDLHRTWSLGKKFSLRQFVDGIFRVKSNKWDTHYELLSKIDVNFPISSSDYWFHLEMDHGS